METFLRGKDLKEFGVIQEGKITNEEEMTSAKYKIIKNVLEGKGCYREERRELRSDFCIYPEESLDSYLVGC